MWWENVYPALRVDVPNLFYSYSFARHTDWSSFYSPRDELQAYVERCAREFGVTDHVRFGHEVLTADYDPASARWTVQVQTPAGATTAVECNAVISAVGMLNRPCIPDLPGLDSFAGRSFHSSRWPDDLDVAGKRVAVIGTGASSVQLVPAIAPAVEHVDVFQRSKHWMMPNPAYLVSISDADRRLMRDVSHYAGWFRFLELWNSSDRMYPAFRVDPEWSTPEVSISPANEKIRVLMTRHLHRELGDDEELVARVLPDYPPLGKRMLQDGGWFATLKRDNVDLVVESIDHVAPEGIVTRDGVTHPADVLVLATGFHARRFLWPMAIGSPRGRLHDVWGDEPRALPRHHRPRLPEPVLPLRPEHQPGRGQRDLHVGVPGRLRRPVPRRARGRRRTPRWSAGRTCTTSTTPGSTPSTSRWCGGTPRCTATTTTTTARVVTNAPWRLIDYWHMTREPDPSDFVFVPDGRAAAREEAR